MCFIHWHGWVSFSPKDEIVRWVPIREFKSFHTKCRGLFASSYSSLFQPGIIAHEFGHALGLVHEQTRPDRDDYVEILEKNVNVHYKSNFKKNNWDNVDSYDIPYDYESIMHYGSDVSIALKQ